MVVVTTASVVILTMGRDISLGGRVTVQATNVARTSTEVERLGSDVTVGKDREDSQDCGKIGTHVETTCGGFQNLAVVYVAVARQVTVIGEKVETRARSTAVASTRCLEFIPGLRALVVGIQNTLSDGSWMIISMIASSRDSD